MALSGSTWTGRAGNSNSAKNRRKMYVANSDLFNPRVFGNNRMRRYRTRDLPF